MKSVIRNYEDAEKFIKRMNFDKPQLIECRFYRPPRTLPQNAKFHAMLGELANHIGYSLSDMKDYFKSEFGPKKFFRFGTHEALVPKSTTEYSKLEMIDMIDHIDRVAAELGYQFSEDANENDA